jgi:hypothetical protein
LVLTGVDWCRLARAQVKDPKQFLCSQLAQTSAQQPLSPVIKTLPQEVQQALMGYCQLAGVAIQ